MSQPHPTDVAQAGKGGVLLNVKVQPRAQKPGVQGVRNGALLVRIKAAPEKGRANKELVDTLAKFLGAPKADLEITAGAASRDKRVLINNATLGKVARKIESLPEL